jgi:hypothetical protein
VRYRAVVATRTPDAFHYSFSEEGLDRMTNEAFGKPVRLIFAEDVGEVVAAERARGQAAIVFETVRELVGAGQLYCVPSFVGGELHSFGLVPVPADSNLTPVEVVE